MDIQIVIVSVILLAALFYIGKNLLLKAKSFSTKNACSSDCGCDAKQKAK